MILRGSSDQQLTLDVSEPGPRGTPSDDDLLLDVSVSVGGYAAADQAWVVGSDWRRFMQQLQQLERTRTGHAVLLGASPGDLDIKFAVVDAAGHMSVSGAVAWRTSDGFLQRLEFGFFFDPGMLASVQRELCGFAQAQRIRSP